MFNTTQDSSTTSTKPLAVFDVYVPSKGSVFKIKRNPSRSAMSSGDSRWASFEKNLDDTTKDFFEQREISTKKKFRPIFGYLVKEACVIASEKSAGRGAEYVYHESEDTYKSYISSQGLTEVMSSTAKIPTIVLDHTDSEGGRESKPLRSDSCSTRPDDSQPGNSLTVPDLDSDGRPITPAPMTAPRAVGGREFGNKDYDEAVNNWFDNVEDAGSVSEENLGENLDEEAGEGEHDEAED